MKYVLNTRIFKSDGNIITVCNTGKRFPCYRSLTYFWNFWSTFEMHINSYFPCTRDSRHLILHTVLFWPKSSELTCCQPLNFCYPISGFSFLFTVQNYIQTRPPHILKSNTSVTKCTHSSFDKMELNIHNHNSGRLYSLLLY